MSGSGTRKGGKHRKRPAKPRSGVLLKALVIGAATMVAAALGASQVSAMPDAPPPPAAGSALPMKVTAEDVPLTVDGQQITRSFEGSIKLRVRDSSQTDRWKLKLRVTALHMVSEDERADGFGKLTIDHQNGNIKADSVLELTGKHPPSWQQTLSLAFTLSIEKRYHVPNTNRVEDPLVLTTTKPGKLVGKVDNFPPKGAKHELREPIDLVHPQYPNRTVATIDGFPIRTEGA
ncbi:MAG: hypothetical protein GEU98_18805 [Pseudonocardiaceae bacterium]|nr:hypothetical protein [Pseudonocardiaceae bacterium]